MGEGPCTVWDRGWCDLSQALKLVQAGIEQEGEIQSVQTRQLVKWDTDAGTGGIRLPCERGEDQGQLSVCCVLQLLNRSAEPEHFSCPPSTILPRSAFWHHIASSQLAADVEHSNRKEGGGGRSVEEGRGVGREESSARGGEEEPRRWMTRGKGAERRWRERKRGERVEKKRGERKGGVNWSSGRGEGNWRKLGR